MVSDKVTNCTFIGINAGADITEGDGIVIIGDNIRSLDRSQEDVLFISDRVAIGNYLMGSHTGFKDIILGLIDSSRKTDINIKSMPWLSLTVYELDAYIKSLENKNRTL